MITTILNLKRRQNFAVGSSVFWYLSRIEHTIFAIQEVSSANCAICLSSLGLSIVTGILQVDQLPTSSMMMAELNLELSMGMGI